VVFYEPADRPRDVLPYDPFKAIVAPRPIGWVSTRGADGATNLAPYSFFNAVADAPPMLMFSSAGLKDSAAFARETREFVWNMPTWDLREAMNESSRDLPRGESELDHAEMATAPSRIVGAPRVANAPVAMECVVVSHTELTDRHGTPLDRHLVVGEVVGVHLDERFLTDDGRFDTAAARPIARCGYLDEYAVVQSLFHMARPG